MLITIFYSNTYPLYSNELPWYTNYKKYILFESLAPKIMVYFFYINLVLNIFMQTAFPVGLIVANLHILC